MTSNTHRGAAAPAARRSGMTMWRQIADTLSTEIRDQAFSCTGGRLPSEADLSARFGVNRHTLRQAVGALQIEGLVRVEPGRGMFVQHELLDYALTQRTRYSANLQRQGLLPGQQLLTARELPAPERVRQALRLDRRESVFMVETLNEASGSPLSLAIAYYPAARFAGLLEMLCEGRSSSESLERLGLADYLRAESRITTRMPDEPTARLLKQPANRPLLSVESVDVDLEGRPVKFGETVFCGDRVQLLVAMADAA